MMTATITATATGDDDVDDLEQLDESGADPGPAEKLPHDVVFHILQNERRRYVLKYLQGRDEPVRMCDVAEQVSAWEHDTTVEQLTSKQRQRVYIPLYQNHLTKLDEEGVIDYNQSRGIVERNPIADQFDPYLDADEFVDEDDDADADVNAAGERTASADAWGKYYLSVSVFGTALVTAKSLGLSLLASLSGVLLSVTVLAAFSILTLLQLTAPMWQP